MQKLPKRPPSSPSAPQPRATDMLAAEIEALRRTVDNLRTENEHLLDSQLPLEASRDEYVEVFESAPRPSLVLDWRGCIRHANQAAGQLLGQPLRDLVGRRFSSFIVPADRSTLVTHLQGCSEGKTRSCELRLRTATDEGLLVQLSCRQSSRSRRLQITLV